MSAKSKFDERKEMKLDVGEQIKQGVQDGGEKVGKDMPRDFGTWCHILKVRGQLA